MVTEPVIVEHLGGNIGIGGAVSIRRTWLLHWWLEHFAAHFQSVEVNSAFYRLPEADTFCRWRDTVPRDFVFALKASRYLTHIRRLKDPQEPVKRLLSRATHLDGHLGPILLQLPPNFRSDIAPWTGRCSASPPLSEWPSNHDTTHGSPRRLKHVSATMMLPFA